MGAWVGLSKDLLHSDTMWPWNQFWLSLWRGGWEAYTMLPAACPPAPFPGGGGRWDEGVEEGVPAHDPPCCGLEHQGDTLARPSQGISGK